MTDNLDDMERFVFKALQNSIIFTSVLGKLKPSYFSNVLFGKLFSFIEKYHSSHPGKVINYDEIRVLVDSEEQNAITRGELKSEINNVLSDNVKMDEDFSIHITEKFVKDRMAQEIATDLIKLVKTNKPIDFGEVVKKLDNIRFQISKFFPVKMSDIESFWTKAELFTEDDIIKSSLPGINNSLSLGGYVKRSLNIITAPPKAGKSAFLIGETCHAAVTQRKNVLHIFLGDLGIRDGWIMAASNMMRPTDLSRSSPVYSFNRDALLRKNIDEIKSITREFFGGLDNPMDRIVFAAYPMMSQTAETLYEVVMRSIDAQFNGKLDMVVIDYIDNLEYTDESLYERGGRNYAMLSKLAWDSNTVALTASQPKQEYWDMEIIDATSSNSESGRKGQIVDLNLFLGRPRRIDRSKFLGVVYNGLNRRGSTGDHIYLKLHYDHCYIEELSNEVWKDIRNSISKQREEEGLGKRRK